MEFNTLVKIQLFPMLQKYGFEVTEDLKNTLRFKSSAVEINIIYNDYEKSCYIFIGKNGNLLHELRNNAVRELFDSSLSIEQVTPEIFVQNLSTLFETKEGIVILKGNIDNFIRFKISEDNHYTSELLLKQVLETASRAWADNDYVSFVKSIDKIEISKIPQSYQLKYKIAKQKLGLVEI